MGNEAHFVGTISKDIFESALSPEDSERRGVIEIWRPAGEAEVIHFTFELGLMGVLKVYFGTRNREVTESESESSRLRCWAGLAMRSDS